MSDVTVADSGSAPAPASSQVVIDQNPVHMPNPVGPQTGDAPVRNVQGEGHRPPSRMEALNRAYERAVNPPPKQERHQPRQESKPAEAKPGHNHPPEETEKFDLRKRPSDQPRDKGRFAPKQRRGPEAQQPMHGQASANQQQAQYRQLPPNAPYAQPVHRMSEKARSEWHATPESVRGDMHRMQSEFLKAYRHFKGDAEAMKPIKHYHELAQSHGTTLKKALDSYWGMEQTLRKDPVRGLDTIVNNLQLKTADGHPIGLRDIAYHVLSRTPEQLQAIQTANQQTASQQQIKQLQGQVSSLGQHIAQQNYNQQYATVRQGVEQFASQMPRFDELGDLIEREIRLGFDLNTAYRRAALLRPASTQAAQTRNTSAQTRNPESHLRSPNRSISGAPESSFNGRRREPSSSPREAAARAMRALNF